MAGDIGHGDKPTTGEADHLDIREAFDIYNRRQDSCLGTRRLPVEVKVLYSVGPSDECIVTARFEQGVNCRITLQIRTLPLAK